MPQTLWHKVLVGGSTAITNKQFEIDFSKESIYCCRWINAQNLNNLKGDFSFCLSIRSRFLSSCRPKTRGNLETLQKPELIWAFRPRLSWIELQRKQLSLREMCREAAVCWRADHVPKLPRTQQRLFKTDLLDFSINIFAPSETSLCESSIFILKPSI